MVLYPIAVVIVAVFAVWFCGPASGIDSGFRGARPDRDGSDAAHEHRADVGQLWRIDGVICAAGPETSEQRALEV